MRIVFTPGFMQPAAAWEAVSSKLGERYSSVLLEPSEHSYDGRLAELAREGEGAVLCGYSLGGRLALHAVLRDPGRYAGLVTIGVSAGIEASATRVARQDADEKLAGWIETQPIEQIVAVWERQPLFADQSDALVDQQRPGRLAQDPRDLAMTLRTAGQGALGPVWPQLQTLDLPFLAMAGALDDRYAEAARRMASLVPGGRSELIEHAGHAAQLQRPDDVARALVDFLDEHFVQRGV